MYSLEQLKEMVDQELSRLIPTPSSPFSSLHEGVRYILLAPCKRIRPLLSLATAQMLQEEAYKCALLPSCALEMVHTYSLIHDDLPCMDNDLFRRGQLTLHNVYSEGHAVLAGDYLLTYAFEILASAPSLSPLQKIELVSSLAKASGGEGMIGGQIMDIENSSQIEEIHRRKTAALFRSALEFGAIVANATPSVLQTLKTFGIQFGQLFQLVDDVLDKDQNLDEEKALEEIRTLHQDTLNTLSFLPGDVTLLQEMSYIVIESATRVS